MGLHPKIWNSQFKLGETNIYPINIELNDKQIDLIEDIVSCTDSYILVYRDPELIIFKYSSHSIMEQMDLKEIL